MNNTDGVMRFKTWIEERGGELITFLCTCSDDSIWSERLAERSLNPLPNQLITNLSELKEYYKNFKTENLEGELILDTVQEIKSLTDRVETFILEQNID